MVEESSHVEESLREMGSEWLILYRRILGIEVETSNVHMYVHNEVSMTISCCASLLNVM